MSNAKTQLKTLVSKLRADLATHLAAVKEIEATLGQYGISLASRGTGTSGRKVAKKAKRKYKKRRKMAGPKPGAKRKKYKKRAKKATKARAKKGGRKRAAGPASIIGFVWSRKGASTADIAANWAKQGRGKGAAVNTALGKLVKEKKLKRSKVKGVRGSVYRVV